MRHPRGNISSDQRILLGAGLITEMECKNTGINRLKRATEKVKPKNSFQIGKSDRPIFDYNKLGRPIIPIEIRQEQAFIKTHQYSITGL